MDDDNTTDTENGAAQYPYNVIQEAINAAGDGDTVAAGTGGKFSSRNGMSDTTHIQGDGTDATVTLLDAGASTVDGFRITGGSPTIAHNIVENNDRRNAASPDNENTGGGIFATNSDVSMLDNLVRTNTSGRGAGIAIDGGTVVIRGNTVQGNIGVADHGGGLYIAAPSATISQDRIAGAAFSSLRTIPQFAIGGYFVGGKK